MNSINKTCQGYWWGGDKEYFSLQHLLKQAVSKPADVIGQLLETQCIYTEEIWKNMRQYESWISLDCRILRDCYFLFYIVLHFLTSWVLGLQMSYQAAIQSGFLHRLWGAKHQASCLHSKPVIHWATISAPNEFIFTCGRVEKMYL